MPVTVEDSQLSHLTRDRVKIPHNRRLPTRGHLLAVASTSSSDGTLTLDLIQEEDDASPRGLHGCDDTPASVLASECPRSKTDGSLSVRTAESSGKSRSLPREVVVWEKTGSIQTPQSGKRLTAAEKNRCASMDEILTHSDAKTATTATAAPVGRLQELIGQKLEKTERLLTEARGEAEGEAGKVKGGKESTERMRAEAERLLKEAAAAWNQAHQVLEEVRELRVLYRQLDPDRNKQNSDRKSLM